MIPIQFKMLRPDTVVPEYATDGDAAVDLRAAIDEPLTLNPGDVALVPTGFAMFIDDKNFAGLILPRSGLGHKLGIILSNGSVMRNAR
jgi:dUTP pyrophosphatase